MKAEPTTPAKATKEKSLSENFIRVWAPTLVVALFIITFIVQAFEIPSASMEKTLLIGDHVLVDRARFSPSPTLFSGLLPYRPLERGDIVVFMSVTDPGMHLVKRVMGLPGDHIKLVDKVVYRNGVALKEPYAIHQATPGCMDWIPFINGRDNWPSGELDQETPKWADAMSQYLQNGEIVVPSGHFFVMGDNRDCSYDSRYWGFVPDQNLIGRPVLVYWSYESKEQDYEHVSISDRLTSLVSTVAHFATRTRWARTFHITK